MERLKLARMASVEQASLEDYHDSVVSLILTKCPALVILSSTSA